jgi:hypothetical protein
MRDELSELVIRLRHRLRQAAVAGRHDVEVKTALDHFEDLCLRLGDPSLCVEHARWRAQFEQVIALRS